MATKVIMPALGMAQDTGILNAWLKQEGEQVVAGEPLMEVETDKTTVEIEAPASGRLAGVAAQPGEEVPVAQVIAWILAPGEKLPPPEMPASPSPAPSLAAGPIAASPVATRLAADRGIDLRQVTPSSGRITKADVLAHIEKHRDGRPEAGAPRLRPASPKARRLARDKGLDLATVAGSGPENAILAADVEAAGAAALPAAPPPGLSKAWQTMASRLAQSWATAPHFYLAREVDCTRLVAWRQAAQAGTAEKISFTDLLVKAVAVSLRAHPRLNASWADGGIHFNQAINIGLAVATGVATDEGLIVPVIHQADSKSVADLAAARREIVRRAREGRLKLDDLLDGTFTLSNLGMYGIDAFSAIVNPPQAAILAVGRMVDRVVPVEGQPAIRPMMMLTLSADHRLVDGARGAQFMETLARYLEEPLALL